MGRGESFAEKREKISVSQLWFCAIVWLKMDFLFGSRLFPFHFSLAHLFMFPHEFVPDFAFNLHLRRLRIKMLGKGRKVSRLNCSEKCLQILKQREMALKEEGGGMMIKQLT